MGMNNHIIGELSENIKIMNYPFFAEEIESEEPYNRRERKFTSIIGGTERMSSGEYVHREYSFTSTISYPPGDPGAYDHIFKKMMSKPVTVVSQSMGGTFQALIKIHKSFPAPNRIKLDVTVTEVPGVNSNIDGEKKLTVPKVEKIKTKVTKKSTKSSTKGKTNTKKNKSNRNSKTKKNK
ncbi:hypothetical protein [Methanobrevibacter sp.]